jgi:hypothetical protein
MRPISDRRANAILLALALGLAALYGGATALVLWTLNCPEAVEIGGLVFRVAAGLGLIVALFVIVYLAPKNKFEKYMNGFGRLFICLACLSFFILIAPLVVLSFGYFWHWLFGEPTNKEDR